MGTERRRVWPRVASGWIPMWRGGAGALYLRRGGALGAGSWVLGALGWQRGLGTVSFDALPSSGLLQYHIFRGR